MDVEFAAETPDMPGQYPAISPPRSMSSSPSSTSPPPRVRPVMPYDTPIPGGRCAFLELPEEVLEIVFLRLDLAELTRCFRLCKSVNELMTGSTQINLHHTLMASSLRLNPAALHARPDMPHQVPPTAASMLNTLRERLTRFHNLAPSSTSSMRLAEGEGSLYEYLEGVLLRSVATGGDRTHDMAVYDLRAADEWEDEVPGEGEDYQADPSSATSSPVALVASGLPAATQAQFTTTHNIDEVEHPTIIDHLELEDDWATDSDMDSMDEGSDIELGSESEGPASDDEDGSNDGSAADGEVMFTDSSDDEDAFPPLPDGALGTGVINANDPSAMGIRRKARFNFTIMEMAVDPGQDLLVLVSLRNHVQTASGLTNVAYVHLFSLSTFEPHPEAANPVLQWPTGLPRTSFSLDFQICDDSLFILLRMNSIRNIMTGWNWRAGKILMVNIRASARDSDIAWSSFVLLTPSSFVVATMRSVLDTNADANPNDPDVPLNLNVDFTNHLELYAFPEGEIPDTPFTATHIATIDLPHFRFDLMRGIAPVRMGARTDPPPRQKFAQYPLHTPPPFAPDPKSGLVIFDIHCHEMHLHADPPHYVLFMLKSTLLRYLPAPTSPLLRETWSRPAPVIPWEKIAPHARLLGPDMVEPNWVCYVYQNRFVTIEERLVDSPRIQTPPRLVTHLVMYDFDQLRVRKERLARLNRLPASAERDDPAVEGDVDGIELVLSPTESPSTGRLLNQKIVTGERLPYLKVSRPIRGSGSPVPLIDSERIILVRESERRRDGGVEILQF